ncbi:MAG: carboxypeptidase-like regulatory domain-containing protein [Terracidiphilus sp.]|jgi:hypothetical protein
MRIFHVFGCPGLADYIESPQPRLTQYQPPRADDLDNGEIFGLRRWGAEPIANRAYLDCEWGELRRRTPACGPVFAFLIFFAVATPLCSQQPLSNLASEAALPAAPQSQVSAEQSSVGSIHGVVVDRDGTVCEGARISLAQTDSIPPSLRTAISGSDGRFVFGDLTAGAFTLTVTSQGFATQIITGFLHPGESYEAPPVAMLVTTAQSEVHVTASQEEIGQEQLKEEEEQRIFGFIPNFYVSYVPNASPLTSKQKFHLAWRTSIDPITILATGFFAGIEQADNQFSGYGQGSEGYAKRFAANYADNFIGTMLGNALLPSLLKQDPRYFYKGTGTTRSRILYAIANSVMCKSDNGRWQPNYSGLLGGIAAGGISNLYYPAANRNGLSLTFENFGIGIAESAAQNLFQEFLVLKLTPKIPSYNSSKP